MRKAPHVWGWDILPRAVSAGIWRSVRLEVVPGTPSSGFTTGRSSRDQAGQALGVRFQVRTRKPPGLDGFAMRFHGECGDTRFDLLAVEFIAGGCTIPVPGARLWWPMDTASRTLYPHRPACARETVLAERTSGWGCASCAWSAPN